MGMDGCKELMSEYWTGVNPWTNFTNSGRTCVDLTRLIMAKINQLYSG